LSYFSGLQGFLSSYHSSYTRVILGRRQASLFPAGEIFSESVEIEPGDSTYRDIFPPKICSPPIGFRWPTDIGIEAFIRSLKLLGRAYTPFLFTIDALQPILATWFSHVTTNPTEYAIPACSYATIEATAFPALPDIIYPSTIINHRGFSPLMDMHYGLAWRLHCDQVLTTSHNGSQLATFLDVLAARHRWYY
jgi:hypothetical protein